MSLTLFSTVFDVGFHPRETVSPVPRHAATPIAPTPREQKEATPPVENVETGQSDSETGSFFEQKQERFGLATHNTRYAIDLDSQDVVIKVIDPDSQQEVRQIPTEEHVELSKRIQKYQERVFKR